MLMNKHAVTLTRIAEQFNRIKPLFVVIYLFYVLFTVFLLTRMTVIAGDSPGIIYVTVGLLRHNTLRLDPFINQNPLFDLTRAPHYVTEAGGHYYSKFSPVPSLLAAPVYALDFALLGPPAGTEEAVASRYIALSRLSANVLTTLTAIVIFLSLRQIVSQTPALLLTFLYAFGTRAWAAATNTLTSQVSGELLMALALYPLVQIESQAEAGRPLTLRWFFLAGLAVGGAVAARPQLILVAAILSGYALWRSRPRVTPLLAYGLGALPVAVLLLTYNVWAFGSPLATGYGGEAAQGWTTPVWVGLPGIVLSPSHGLLFYSPGLLLAAWGGYAAFRPAPNRESAPAGQPTGGLGRFMVAAVILQLLLMSHWWAWHGGVAYNQRMLQEVHPLLIALAAYGLRRYGDRRALRGALGAALVWGVGMNLARATFYDQHIQWNEVFHADLVWSLRHLEPLMYLQSHGWGGFLQGILLTGAQLLAILAPATFLLWRFSQKKPAEGGQTA